MHDAQIFKKNSYNPWRYTLDCIKEAIDIKDLITQDDVCVIEYYYLLVIQQLILITKMFTPF